MDNILVIPFKIQISMRFKLNARTDSNENTNKYIQMNECLPVYAFDWM